MGLPAGYDSAAIALLMHVQVSLVQRGDCGASHILAYRSGLLGMNE